MKKTFIYGVLTVVIALAAFIGCKKATDTPYNNLVETEGIRNETPTGGELNAFFENNGPQRQVFNFANNNVPLRITLNSGTIITIPANAFTIGGARANGPTTITVRETRNRDDLALSGQSTGSLQLGLLESDGSFDVEITVAGREVDDVLAPGTAFDFSVPVRPGITRPTNLFNGVVTDAAATGTPFDWQPRQVPNQPWNILPNNGRFRFRWPWRPRRVNVDVPVRSIPGNSTANNPLTDLTVLLPNNPGTIADFRASNGGNTVVLFVPRRINGLLQITGGSSNTEVRTAANALAIDTEGQVLAYSVVNGNWWLGVRDITITSNTIVDLPLAPSTEDEVVSTLRALVNL